MSHRPERCCVCSPSSSRVRWTRSGTTSPAAKRAAGILAGCTTNKACGRPSAPPTVFIVRCMNEDGMVEVDQGSFSIEPMLWVEGRLFTWADVVPRQELLREWMPVPSVIWETDDWRLGMRAEATPSGVSRVRYRLENLTGRQLFARLFVLVRPFQVTPPWQSFRGLGGVSPDPDPRLARCGGSGQRDHLDRARERSGSGGSGAIRSVEFRPGIHGRRFGIRRAPGGRAST